MSNAVTGSDEQRCALRSVALPSEHGGWGLTIEPGLLGILIAPSWAGVCLACAALLAFVIRTPIKLVLVDRRRHRRLARTDLAAKVAAVEGAVLVALIVGSLALADDRWFWIALIPAVPFVAVELWYDVRSRSRRLAPEIAGALAVAFVAPAIVLADGGDPEVALAIWFVLAARIVGSVCHVRTQIARVHDRAVRASTNLIADTVAVGAAVVATLIDRALWPALLCVIGIIAFQAVRRRQSLWPVPVIGVSQMLLGIGLVVVTALAA
ncbi:MAG: YwiC-like family protein [Actinomycetota bacterium]